MAIDESFASADMLPSSDGIGNEVFLADGIVHFLEEELTEENLNSWKPRATNNHGRFWFDRYHHSKQSISTLDATVKLEREDEEMKVQSFQTLLVASPLSDKNQASQFYIDLVKDYIGWRPEGIRVAQTLPGSEAIYILESGNYDSKSDEFNWEASREQKATYNLRRLWGNGDSMTAVNIDKPLAEKIIFDAVKLSTHMLAENEKDHILEEQIIQDFHSVLKEVDF